MESHDIERLLERGIIGLLVLVAIVPLVAMAAMVYNWMQDD